MEVLRANHNNSIGLRQTWIMKCFRSFPIAAVIFLWGIKLVIPVLGVKLFLGANVEGDGLVVSGAQQASSKTTCVILCHIDPNCTLTRFSKESGLCNNIVRDESFEPKPSHAGGVKVFFDKNKPRK